MKKSIIPFAIALLAITACDNAPQEPTRDELAQTIDSIEKPLIEATSLESVDTAQGNNLIDLCLKFADSYPTDTLAPVYLQSAAQVACGMGLIDDMSAYYDRIIDNYPDYARLDECYYAKGIALDNAGRKEEARKAYIEFLDEFPDHFLAEDIRRALPLLDMSDEMLLKHLKEIEH